MNFQHRSTARQFPPLLYRRWRIKTQIPQSRRSSLHLTIETERGNNWDSLPEERMLWNWMKPSLFPGLEGEQSVSAYFQAGRKKGAGASLPAEIFVEGEFARLRTTGPFDHQNGNSLQQRSGRMHREGVWWVKPFAGIHFVPKSDQGAVGVPAVLDWRIQPSLSLDTKNKIGNSEGTLERRTESNIQKRTKPLFLVHSRTQALGVQPAEIKLQCSFGTVVCGREGEVRGDSPWDKGSDVEGSLVHISRTALLFPLPQVRFSVWSQKPVLRLLSGLSNEQPPLPEQRKGALQDLRLVHR